MSLQKLNMAQSFGAGSDLWVISDDPATPLFRRMDWYLNFQITRALQHKSQTLSPQLQTVLNENSIPTPTSSATHESPTLIQVGRQLPTQFLMIVPARNSSDWAATVQQRWVSLHNPSMRLFLPPSISIAQFQKDWGPSEPRGLSIVTAAQ
jgi:hypothetical protein